MDEKYTGRKFYGLYDPISPSTKRDPKSVEDIKKQSDVNKETSLSNKALAEANKIAIDKIIAMMNAKQAQDVITFLSKVDAVAQYQPKGDYVTENRIDEKIDSGIAKYNVKVTETFATREELNLATKGVTPAQLKSLKDALELLKDNPDSIAEIAKKADKDNVYTRARIDDFINSLNQKDLDLEKKIQTVALGEGFVKDTELAQRVAAIVDFTPYVTKVYAETTYAKLTDLNSKVSQEQLEKALEKAAPQAGIEKLATKEELSKKADKSEVESKVDVGDFNDLKQKISSLDTAIKTEAASRASTDLATDSKIGIVNSTINDIKADILKNKQELTTQLVHKADTETMATLLSNKVDNNSLDLVKASVEKNKQDIFKANIEINKKANAAVLENYPTKEELRVKTELLTQNIEDVKTIANKAKLAAESGKLATDAKALAEDNKVKVLAIEEKLKTLLTKALADSLYQEKGNYATKEEVQAITTLDPSTVQALKDLARQLAGHEDLAAVLEKLDKIYTKQQVDDALSRKVDVTALSEYATKQELTTKTANIITQSEVETRVLKAESKADTAVREVNTTAQQAKSKAQDNAQSINEINTKLTKAIEDATALSTKVNNLALKAGEGGKVDPNAVVDKVKEVLNDLVIKNKYVSKPEMVLELDKKANASELELLRQKVTSNETAIASKVSVSDLSTKVESSVFNARTTEVDNKFKALETTKIPSVVATQIEEKLKTYQPKGEYLTKTTADTYYQPVGSYIDNDVFSQANIKISKHEEDIAAIKAAHYVHQSELANYSNIETVNAAIQAAVAGLDTTYAKKSDVSTFIKGVDVDKKIATKIGEFKTYTDSTFATKNEIDNARTLFRTALSQTAIEKIVDDKLGTVKDAVQTIVNIQSGVNQNKSAVQSILTELAKKATKEEIDGKLDKQVFETAKTSLTKLITDQESALAEAKKALQKAIDDKSAENVTNYQSKVEFANWIRDTYTVAIQDLQSKIKSDQDVKDLAQPLINTAISGLSDVYQPKGQYVTSDGLTNRLLGYLEEAYADTRYQMRGSYVTKTEYKSDVDQINGKIDTINTSLNGKLDLTAAQSVFQTRGDYVTRGDLDAAATTPAFANAINNAIIAKNFLDKDTAKTLFAAKANYTTAQNVGDIIQNSVIIQGKQDKITFGSGLSYNTQTKTLTATGGGATGDLSQYAKKTEVVKPSDLSFADFDILAAYNAELNLGD